MFVKTIKSAITPDLSCKAAATRSPHSRVRSWANRLPCPQRS